MLVGVLLTFTADDQVRPPSVEVATLSTRPRTHSPTRPAGERAPPPRGTEPSETKGPPASSSTPLLYSFHKGAGLVSPTRCTTGLSMTGYKARCIPQMDYFCIPGVYSRMRTSENSVHTKFGESTFYA